MTSDKALAYTTNVLFEAELLKSYLADREINAFLLNKMDSAYHFGEIEIYVFRDDIIRAKKLIGEYFSNE